MKHFENRQRIAVLSVAVLVSVAVAFAAKEKDPAAGTRTVQGFVTSAEGEPVPGAVVQLKNTKNLQIRSFIAKEDGTYYFNGLSPDIDYELRAEYQGASSPTKTLSAFDNRKQAIINLQLNKK
jgi:hypothetical protein